MLLYIYFGVTILSGILYMKNRTLRGVLEAPAYFGMIAMTYAVLNYFGANVLGLNMFDKSYKYVSIACVGITVAIFLLWKFLIDKKYKERVKYRYLKKVVLLLFLVISIVWLLLYAIGLNFDFDLLFFELCVPAYFIVVMISLLLFVLNYKKIKNAEEIENKWLAFELSANISLWIVFIMGAGSHATRVYTEIFAFLFAFVTIYYLITSYKKMLVSFSLKKNSEYRKNFKKFVPGLLLFGVLLYGENSLEFFGANINTIPFGLGAFYIDYLRIIAAIVIGGAGLFALLKEKYGNKVNALIFGVDVAVYIQVMFLNRNLGQTDMEVINWMDYKWSMLLGVIVWAAIIAISLRFSKKNEKGFGEVVKAGSIFLIILQIVSIIYLFISIGGWSGQVNSKATDAYVNCNYYLTNEGQFEVSKNNVVLFILDTFSNDYMDTLMERDANTMDEFQDFTYYSNYNVVYDGTALAVPYMLTGNSFDYEQPCIKATSASFKSENAKYFYDNLKEKNIDARFYTDIQTQAWVGVQNLQKYYSNVGFDENLDLRIDYDLVLSHMNKSVMYRVLPFVAKPFFLIVTDDFLETAEGKQSEKGEIATEDHFVRTADEDKFTLDDKESSFLVYHFGGMHEASTYDDDKIAKMANDNLNIIRAYMEELKRLGVYDDTTIIVTADHGIHETVDGSQAIFMIKEAGVSRDSYVESKAPIDAADLLPTIMRNFDLDGEKLGRTIYDIDEKEERERTVYVRKLDDSLLSTAKKANTNLSSSFNCLYQFNYVGDKETLRARDEEKPDKKIVLVDFWW